MDHQAENRVFQRFQVYMNILQPGNTLIGVDFKRVSMKVVK